MRNRLVRVVLVLCVLWVWGCESGTKVEEVDPEWGNVAGNDDVVIKGSGFKAGMVVQFGDRQVKSVIIDSPTRIRVKTPSGVEGRVDVVIIDEDGKTYVLKNGFEYKRGAPGS